MKKTKETLTFHLLTFKSKETIKKISISPQKENQNNNQKFMNEFNVKLKNVEMNQEWNIPHSVN